MINDKFVFYSKSPNGKPGKNKGTDWSEYVNDKNKYKELEKIDDWRKMLSNFYISPFILDDKEWNSVEHFFHAVKFRDKNNIKNYNYYKTFSIDSNSPWSLDPELSKYAGKAGMVGKTGKIYDKKIGNEKIPKDVTIRPDFYTTDVEKKAMKLAFFSKFTQNDLLKNVLLNTKDAELYHLVTRRGHKSKIVLWNDLMEIRECIRKFEILNLSEISKIDSTKIDNILKIKNF